MDTPNTQATVLQEASAALCAAMDDGPFLSTTSAVCLALRAAVTGQPIPEAPAEITPSPADPAAQKDK
jgi:hypothetical protein